ncbi:MAG TPA: zinc ribbon domain-containing protein, partial [Nevskiaceae bacterium]|nr:zinc ribbon domain-containing protein [Nevskiaceae bacterium]
MSAADRRPLPQLTPENRAFWTGGEHGRLMIHRCEACGHWIHPPSPICPHCRARDVSPHAASGRGTVATFTVNHQPWRPTMAVPFVV